MVSAAQLEREFLTAGSCQGLDAYFAGFAAAPAAGGFSPKDLDKLPPDLKKTFAQLSQSGADIKSLLGQLPQGVNPQTLLQQAGVNLNLDSVLSQAGIPGIPGAGVIAQGAAALGQKLLSGKADAEDVAREVSGVVSSVLSQAGGPASAAGASVASALTSALGIQGTGSAVGGATGSAVGLVFGPAGAAVGQIVGQAVGGAAEQAAEALGVGGKARRIEHERTRSRDDVNVRIPAFAKAHGAKFTTEFLYDQFRKGNVQLTFGVVGSSKFGERTHFAVVKGKLKKLDEPQSAVLWNAQPKVLTLASNMISKQMFDRIQGYEKSLQKKQKDDAKKALDALKIAADKKLAARSKLKSALQTTLKHGKTAPRRPAPKPVPGQPGLLTAKNVAAIKKTAGQAIRSYQRKQQAAKADLLVLSTQNPDLVTFLTAAANLR